MILSTYKDYGIMWDEKVFIAAGQYYLAAIFDFLNPGHNLPRVNLDSIPFIKSHLKAHGVILDIFFAAIILFFKLNTFEALHLLRAFLAIPIFILVALIVRKILNARAAYIAPAIMLCMPIFYGLMFVSPIDVPTALFFAIAVSYFSYFLYSNQKLKSQIIFGLIFALLINQRLIFIYLLLTSLFIIFLIERKKVLTKILTILVSTLFFMHLTHPYLFTHPVTGLWDMIIEAQKFPFEASVLFEGKSFLPRSLPWYYLPKTMIITTPLSILFLFFVGNFALIKSYLNEKGNSRKKFIYLYILLIFYLPFILVFIIKPPLYDSWRQFLFLVVPIAIISSYGFDFILKTRNNLIKIIILGLIFFNFMQTASEMKALHPYEYIYYNQLVGGLPGAYGKYETEYLGLAYKEAAEWFNQNVNDGKSVYKIKTEGDPLSSIYYFKKNMHLVGAAENADYVFVFTRWNMDKLYDGKIIHTIKRQGVPLIFIKKVR